MARTLPKAQPGFGAPSRYAGGLPLPRRLRSALSQPQATFCRGCLVASRLKRAFLRVEVVRRGNDPKLKYYMFKRLNSGGVPLEPQQIRNSTIRLLDATFNNFIVNLSRYEHFSNTVSTTSYESKQAFYDQELVLRFFAFKNRGQDFKHDIEDFLTEYME